MIRPQRTSLTAGAILCLAIMVANAGTDSAADNLPRAVDYSEIGVTVGANYQGNAIGVHATPTGARLHTGFQKLVGYVTDDGLLLESSEDAGDALRLSATTVGRAGMVGRALRTMGTVKIDAGLVTWERPGLVEEYSVSVDGLRQDFIVNQAPAGSGTLSVELALEGACAFGHGEGARLTLAESGRDIAYTRLHVTDATGHELPAHLKVLDSIRLVVLVDDYGATYPVRIDPTFSDADWVSMGSGIPGANGEVSAMVVDAGGSLYIGGNFSFVGSVEANRIAKWNGSEWSPLGQGIGLQVGNVYALTMIGSDLYAGGSFTWAGGVAANYVAKWDGTEWSALGTGMSNGLYTTYVYSLASKDNVLFAGGRFTTAGGVSANSIAAWDGTTWASLGEGMSGGNPSTYVYALALLGNDLYAGGNFFAAGGTAAGNIARWDGVAWSPLGEGISGGSRPEVYALAASGNDLYAGGEFTAAGGVSANAVAKWNGNSWSPLGDGVNNGALSTSVRALAVMGGELYAGGDFIAAGQVLANRIAKWNGSLWSGLGDGMGGGGLSRRVNSLAFIGNDLFSGGAFTWAGSVGANYIARWNGNEWSCLGDDRGVNGTVYALALTSSEIYAGGSFISVGGQKGSNIAKWNGCEWSTLGLDMKFGTVYALAISGNTIFAGGDFTTANGTTFNHIAQWNGIEWSSLGSGMSGSSSNTVMALAVSGSDLYVGGKFKSAGGVPANQIAKWNGTAWSALGVGVDNAVRALAVSGDNLYAGGDFIKAGGVTVNRLAKWNGSVWSSLAAGVNGSVNALATSGNELYAGGVFTSAGTVVANHIARWNGSTWSALAWGTPYGSWYGVHALAVSGTDLYVGGQFNFRTGDGSFADNTAKWNGSEWSVLGSGTSRRVVALAISGGRLCAGGSFHRAGGKVSPYIAMASIPADLPETKAVVLEQPAGTVLANGCADSFGRVPIGSSVDLDFTIRNSGEGILHLTGAQHVALSGENAAEFIVLAQPVSPVAVGGASTFSVRFSPTTSGVKASNLTIISDADNDACYSIMLIGEGINSSPTISKLADQTIAMGLSLGDLAFTVGDAETSPDELHVVATSDNATLVPSDCIVLGGSGTSRTVSFAPEDSKAGIATITLTVSDGELSSFVSFKVRVLPEAIRSLEDWRLLHYATMDNTGAAWDLATPDGDGIANLVKYALLIEPGRDGTSLLPRATSAKGHFEIALRRDSLRTDITIIVEARDSLGPAWHELARSAGGAAFVGTAIVTETDSGGSVHSVIVRDTVPVGSAACRFLRVRVER